MRVVGTVQNTLKGGEAEQRGGDTKIFKKEGQAGSRGGCLKMGLWGECLKKGVMEPPYEPCSHSFPHTVLLAPQSNEAELQVSDVRCLSLLGLL